MKRRKTKVAASDWKFLAVIRANVTFEDVLFNYKDCAIRILANISEMSNELHFVEVYTKRRLEKDINTAYYRSIDLLNEFLDQLSFITFQPAAIEGPIAISYARTKIGKKFPMLHIHPSIIRKNIRLKKVDLIEYESLSAKGENIFNLLRLLNYYQNSSRLDDKFLHLYSVIDFIASIESKEYQIKKCENCNAEIKLNHKATGNYIKKLAETYKVDDFNLNKIRSFRAKIAHGAKKRDFSFFNSLATYLPKLETLAYSAILDRLPLKMKLTTNIHSYTPLLSIKGKSEKITPEIIQEYPEAKDRKYVYFVNELKMNHQCLFTHIEVSSDDKESPISWPEDIDDLDGSFGIDFDGEFGKLPISEYAWPYCES